MVMWLKAAKSSAYKLHKHKVDFCSPKILTMWLIASYLAKSDSFNLYIQFQDDTDYKVN